MNALLPLFHWFDPRSFLLGLSIAFAVAASLTVNKPRYTTFIMLTSATTILMLFLGDA